MIEPLCLAELEMPSHRRRQTPQEAQARPAVSRCKSGEVKCASSCYQGIRAKRQVLFALPALRFGFRVISCKMMFMEPTSTQQDDSSVMVGMLT